jgi:hypothetical protein
MKWAKPIQDEVTAHLAQLGLSKCPVCDAEALGVYDKPAMMVSGGAPWPNPGRVGPMDKDAQMDFMVRIECNLCGYNLLFNLERFHDSNTPVMEP